MAYFNVNSVFLGGGHKAQCTICNELTDVPMESYGPVDLNGKRIDGD